LPKTGFFVASLLRMTDHGSVISKVSLFTVVRFNGTSFGASRLRDIGGALGGAISEFRSSVSGPDEEDKETAEGEKE